MRHTLPTSQHPEPPSGFSRLSEGLPGRTSSGLCQATFPGSSGGAQLVSLPLSQLHRPPPLRAGTKPWSHGVQGAPPVPHPACSPEKDDQLLGEGEGLGQAHSSQPIGTPVGFPRAGEQGGLRASWRGVLMEKPRTEGPVCWRVGAAVGGTAECPVSCADIRDFPSEPSRDNIRAQLISCRHAAVRAQNFYSEETSSFLSKHS